MDYLLQATIPDSELSTLDRVCKIMSVFDGQTHSPHIVLADQGDSEVGQEYPRISQDFCFYRFDKRTLGTSPQPLR